MGGKEDHGEQQEQTSTEGENKNGEIQISMPSNGEQYSSIAKQQHQKTLPGWGCLPYTARRKSGKTPIRHDEQEQPSTQELSSSFTNALKNLSQDDKELIKDIDKQLKIGEDEDNTRSQSRTTKIQKVPKIIKTRKIYKVDYIKPKVIAIGPIYANDEKLNNIVVKHRLAARFIKDSGKSGYELLDKFKQQIETDDDKLEDLFESKIVGDLNDELKDNKLIRMLFLDGCSVLQFIDSYVNNDIKESDGISNGKADQILHDLFLMENQIPFKVLLILMRLSEKELELAILNLYHFVSMNIMAPTIYSKQRLDQKRKYLSQKKDKKQVFGDNNMPVHLLDLLRSELLFDDDRTEMAEELSSATKEEKKEGGDRAELFSTYYKRSFRNVEDLKEAGIKLKPDYSSGLRSVSFSSRFHVFGQLKLPPLIVDESTPQKLLNLVAYEMCPGNNKKNYAVTSYLRLLDSLIDSEEDVKHLRSAHILRNNLSSDKEVADLFNNIGSSLVPHDAYLDVKKDIQKHYERKLVNWKAQFYREHCRNPWTILAVLAAKTALILTGIQTYYSVHPKKE
ncbi:UPF0481 protein At3g47200-like [Humulus lupulus]|uniref:UPF0481 protein At3g47200-like n=1 Tax=Humulus lupulus TaxID=3486 RepID=UPI002B41155E|nr:UPF0481 protein At3g47200-like [Humulus lupulus]